MAPLYHMCQEDFFNGLLDHTFRHILVTRLLGHTGNLRLAQQVLGHRSIGSTIR